MSGSVLETNGYLAVLDRDGCERFKRGPESWCCAWKCANCGEHHYEDDKGTKLIALAGPAVRGIDPAGVALAKAVYKYFDVGDSRAATVVVVDVYSIEHEPWCNADLFPERGGCETCHAPVVRVDCDRVVTEQ